MGNITGTSEQLRNQVRSKFDLPKVICHIIDNTTVLTKPFAKNYVWVASNMAKEGS